MGQSPDGSTYSETPKDYILVQGNEFIFQSLIKKDIEGFWKKITTGSTFESLNSNDIKNSNLLVPVNEEQIKIGQYFSQLDNLITLHQRL